MAEFRPEMISVTRRTRRKDGKPITKPKEKPMTIKDLSKLMGVAESTIWSWENGLTNIRATDLARISVLLGVDVGIFYE